jgi:hypothetical protein
MAKTKESKDKPAQPSYPLTLKGELEEPLSRWLWLVKWLFIIPHAIVLFFLWIAVGFVTAIAFFAILFAGRYPRPLFDFTVGVLRWSWRVSFYSCGALATDQYPPFSLGEADYPADLEVEYPEKLINWMPLVKWLFAIPHYACLAALAGWGWWHSAPGGSPGGAFPFGGLLWVLVMITAVLLLFTGKYRQDIWQLVMGVNRWSFRVFAYVGLLTDEYPPFRLSE